MKKQLGTLCIATVGTLLALAALAFANVTSNRAVASATSFSLGNVKLNQQNGTATLTVKVPGPGSLLLSGNGVKTVTQQVSGAGKVKLAITPTGSTKQQLKTTGTAKVKVKVTFTPTGLYAVTQTKSKVVHLKEQVSAKPPAGCPAEDTSANEQPCS